MLVVVLHPDYPPTFYRNMDPELARLTWLDRFSHPSVAARASLIVEARVIKSLEEFFDFCPEKFTITEE